MYGIPIIILQVVLLAAWYTITPTLPAWVVFLPLILSGIAVVVFSLFCVIGLAVFSRGGWR